MENVFKYYEFSSFFEDRSETFLESSISYTELNEQHFLIFEKKVAEKEVYNLYISKYKSKKDIGVGKPEILELLVENYDKSIPEHRIIMKKYMY